jgi:hypothetical protein
MDSQDWNSILVQTVFTFAKSTGMKDFVRRTLLAKVGTKIVDSTPPAQKLNYYALLGFLLVAYEVNLQMTHTSIAGSLCWNTERIAVMQSLIPILVLPSSFEDLK